MKILLIVIVWACLIGCSNKSSEETVENSIYGEWHIDSRGNTSLSGRGTLLKINSDGTFIMKQFVGFSNGGNPYSYYRKSEGRFVQNGDDLNVTYTYETCNSIKTETVNIKLVNSEQILVKFSDNQSHISFFREDDSSRLNENQMLEDTSCIFAKNLEKSPSRIPASIKK